MLTTIQFRHRFTLYPALRQLLAMGLALASGPLAAQPGAENAEETARWYQIEILIFANKRGLENGEVWPRDIKLNYPLNWVTLKDPDKIAEEFAAAARGLTPAGDVTATDDLAPLDASSASALEATAELAAELAARPQPAPPPAIASAPRSADEPTAAAPGDSSGEAESSDAEPVNQPDPENADIKVTFVPADLQREPFYLLPAKLRKLESNALAIKRSYNYRLLFHAAWRQPVVDQPEAPSVLIAAGEGYGQHFELEGSLSISVARYLHLNTNLWLTRFTHNYGQDRGSWPELPLRPDQRDYLPSTKGSDTESLPAWDTVIATHDEYDRILSTPFIPERISTMKQTRRMRSGEVHYIDHPHFGVVILCTPYDVPAAIAADDAPLPGQ